MSNVEQRQPEPMSLRAYALRRGVSPEAVSRAIRSGRLRDSVVTVGRSPKIADPELADREWAANTDPARGTNSGDESDQSYSYWRAKKMELDARKAAGELVNAADEEA